MPSSSKRTLSNDDAGTSQQEGRSPKRPRPDSTALMNNQSPRVPDNAIVERTLEQQKQDEHILMLSTKLALLEKELQDVKTIAFTLVGTVTPSTTMLMHQAMSEMVRICRSELDTKLKRVSVARPLSETLHAQSLSRRDRLPRSSKVQVSSEAGTS